MSSSGVTSAVSADEKLCSGPFFQQNGKDVLSVESSGSCNFPLVAADLMVACVIIETGCFFVLLKTETCTDLHTAHVGILMKLFAT